jgi:hypothetical protein
MSKDFKSTQQQKQWSREDQELRGYGAGVKQEGDGDEVIAWKAQKPEP